MGVSGKHSWQRGWISQGPAITHSPCSAHPVLKQQNLPFVRQGGHPFVKHEVVSSGEDRGGVSEEWAGWQVNLVGTLEGR